MLITVSHFDEDRIRSINERLPFPPRNLNDPLYISKRIIDIDGEVVAAGLLRLTSEAILMLNPESAKRYKVTALKELINLCKIDCQKFNIDEVHAFLTGDADNFSRVLKKLGFEDATG